MNITFARACAAAVLVLSLGVAGCGSPDVDIAKVVKVGDVTTGWFDVGIVDGQNKLVPTAVFTVTNTGTETLAGLQVFTVFRFIGETEELGSGLVVLRGNDALAPYADQQAHHRARQLGLLGSPAPGADADAQPVQGRARRDLRQVRRQAVREDWGSEDRETVAHQVEVVVAVDSSQKEDTIKVSRCLGAVCLLASGSSTGYLLLATYF